MTNHEELEYIQRILKGEIDLFSYFVKNNSQSIYVLIVRIVTNKEETEELVQDAFVKAFTKLHSFKGECSFSTWLYRIAYNTAITATRKKKHSFTFWNEETLSIIPADEDDFIVEHEPNQDLIAKLHEALEYLTAEERTLITLFYTENKSIHEIALIMDLTTDNVKVRLHRTRKKLQIWIKK